MKNEENKKNQERLDRFKKMGIPKPIMTMPEPFMYNLNGGLNGFKNPEIFNNINSIKKGEQKNLIKDVLKYDSKKIINKIQKDGLYEDRDRSAGLKNHVKLNFFNPTVDFHQAKTYDELLSGKISEDTIEKTKTSDIQLVKAKYQTNEKNGFENLENKIKNLFNELKNRNTNDESIKKLEKDYGTYYTKRHELLTKKEITKVDSTKADNSNKIKIVINKITNFFKTQISKIKTIISNKISSFKSWRKNISTAWANYKIRMVLSQQQIDILNDLASAKIREAQEEPSNIPNIFKHYTKHHKGFDYKTMRSLNERVMQIPE